MSADQYIFGVSAVYANWCVQSARVSGRRRCCFLSLIRGPQASWLWPRQGIALGICSISVALSFGCRSRETQVQLARENTDLKQEIAECRRVLAARDERLTELEKQVQTLQDLGPDRQIAPFAPIKLEIASLSRGIDLDGKTGDDGVAVYLRPKDADGDTVKAPGLIRIELLDLSVPASPRVVGQCEVSDLESLRRLWHGKFATQHYSVKCPFDPGDAPPAGQHVTVRTEFVDFLSGNTLTAVRQVPITPARDSPVP